MRAFVHIQERAHSMTCAMQIVHALLPHRITGTDIKLCAAAPSRETHHGQANVPPEHQCIVNPFLLCQCSQGYRSGNVSGTILILGTAVQQKQSFWEQFAVALLVRLIMHNGTVRGITSYRVKGKSLIQRLHGTELFQFAADGKFCLATGLHRRQKPM